MRGRKINDKRVERKRGEWRKEVNRKSTDKRTRTDGVQSLYWGLLEEIIS